MSTTRREKELYICNNINNILLIHRKQILQIIFNSQSRDKLKEKGNGTTIKLSDLHINDIQNIQNIISQKINL